MNSSEVNNKISDSRLSNGDMLIHTAIDNHNVFVIEHLLKLSESKNFDQVNSKGITSIDLAKLRDNAKVLKLFGINESCNPDEIFMRINKDHRMDSGKETIALKSEIQETTTPTNKNLIRKRSNKINPSSIIGEEEEKVLISGKN